MNTTWAALRRFARDESGVAVLLVTVMLPAIIGFSLLAIDMSRVNNLHNDLQKAADALALAAAAELDGNSHAFDRAERAMENLVDNSTNFSTNGVTDVAIGTPVDITIGSGPNERHCRAGTSVVWCFLDSLPPNDSDPIVDNTYDTQNDAEARFIQVMAKPVNFTTIFPASFLGASNDLSFGAQAVAGFGSGVCDFTPVFICNPYDPSPNAPAMYDDSDPPQRLTLESAFADLKYRRRQIELRTVGGNAAYFPGNFGFLDTPGANGARSLAEMIASARPQQCYSSRGVDTKTGQNSGPVKGAFNVRFGIQEPGANFNGEQYGPAENVRKGAEPTNGTACPNGNKITYPTDPPATTGVMGLPTDPCFADGSCTLMGGRMGSGNWNFNNADANNPGYWQVNHPGVPVPAELSGTGDNLPSRYQVYRYEIDHNMIADASPGGETGVPKTGCGTPITYVDRRLIYGAVLNCQSLEDDEYSLSGHQVGLPVQNFASFFITEPVKNIPNTEYDSNVFVELVDVTGRAGAGTLTNFARDETQLYR